MSLSNKFDSNIYIEPDGSSWVRIFHHNNPQTYGVFVHHSDSEWDAGIYGTENKWFDLGILNDISGIWELMVKQATTSGGTEQKWRWTQAYNPLTTTAWATAQPGTVTFNTSTGYSTSSWGGLWKMNSSSRMNIANSSSGNWFGAIGSWTVYQNGFPGYPNTTVTTGYLDLYVRVDSLLEPISEKGLLLWLPLNGNLHNHGICQDLPVTNNGATISNTGKIGECYTFTNTTISVGPSQTFKSSFSAGASLAFWVKVSTSHNSYAQALVLGTVGTSWNDLKFGVDINANGNQIVAVSNGTNSTQCSSDVSIKDGVWHHIAATYKTGEIQVYVDGVLKKTAATSYVPAWNSLTTIGIGGNSSEVFKNGDAMNDVRVYNYALSAKEVKEISKALVLHYKLDGLTGGNPNLGTGSRSLNLSPARTNVNFGGYNSPTLQTRDDGFTEAKGTQNWRGIMIYANSLNLQVGQNYTYSFYIRGNGTTRDFSFFPMMFNSSGVRDTSSTLPISFDGEDFVAGNARTFLPSHIISEPEYHYCTFTWNQTMADIINNGGYIQLTMQVHGTWNTGDWACIWAPKLEKGSTPTIWSPSPLDEGYSSSYFNVCFDSSGYCDGSANYATKYIMPGQNLPGNTGASGNTQYYGDGGIILNGTGTDTYFSIWYDKPLEQGKIYTLSCNASGLLPGTKYTFPYFAQSYTSMGHYTIDHNGRNFMATTMNYTGSIPTTTVNGKTLYRMFMDDSIRTIASGQGPITLSDFRLEEGWGSRIATKWQYDTTGSIETTSGSPRYDSTVFINSNNPTTSAASGTVYLEAPCVLLGIDKLTVACWVKPIAGYGLAQGWFSLTNNNVNPGQDYTTAALNQYDNQIRLNGINTDYTMNSIASAVVNTWQHFVITYDGLTAKVYRNGEFRNSASMSAATNLGLVSRLLIGFSYAGGVWRRNQAYYSDFRVYTTALSDADVLELYQTSASIDRDGNYYTRELIEQ